MELATLIIGTWAITTAFTESDGPYGSLYKLRKQKQINDFGLLECFLCTSFWVALTLCMAFQSPEYILIAWGVSTLTSKLLTAYMSK